MRLNSRRSLKLSIDYCGGGLIVEGGDRSVSRRGEYRDEGKKGVRERE